MKENENKEEINKDENNEKTVNPVEEYVQKLNEERQKMISGKQVQTKEEKPDYLLPQFKNVEEQAKSYKELQALQTKQAQELAQLKKTAAAENQKSSYNMQLADINRNAIEKKRHLDNIYAREMDNLRLALQMGKITEAEAARCVGELKNFVNNKLNELNYQFQNACQNCGQPLDMVSPTEYFQEELKTKNYLSPVCEFLEKNYKKLSQKELGEIKNLVNTLENSLRDEILNENRLSAENETYRANLASATNLNPQSVAEKIFTLEEVKNMKPDEFRKNQQAILEQFVSQKIK